MHNKILVSPDSEKSTDTAKFPQKSSSKPKKKSVRKYRENNKAHTTSPENEVLHLASINEQLIRRLQVQATLEAVIAILKCLLADFRGRIYREFGSYPYQTSSAIETIAGGVIFGLTNGAEEET